MTAELSHILDASTEIRQNPNPGIVEHELQIEFETIRAAKKNKLKASNSIKERLAAALKKKIKREQGIELETPE